jgi:hypothetical protein
MSEVDENFRMHYFLENNNSKLHSTTKKSEGNFSNKFLTGNFGVARYQDP